MGAASSATPCHRQEQPRTAPPSPCTWPPMQINNARLQRDQQGRGHSTPARCHQPSPQRGTQEERTTKQKWAESTSALTRIRSAGSAKRVCQDMRELERRGGRCTARYESPLLAHPLPAIYSISRTRAPRITSHRARSDSSPLGLHRRMSTTPARAVARLVVVQPRACFHTGTASLLNPPSTSHMPPHLPPIPSHGHV
ncbi:hypothetical protein DFH09DRAFT_1072858 [Mycena vulgaris]|nr:hypothetical protein DFH09DRAFT_1072858 [Mycena vulgaris]